jgi:hypothetical protein
MTVSTKRTLRTNRRSQVMMVCTIARYALPRSILTSCFLKERAPVSKKTAAAAAKARTAQSTFRGNRGKLANLLIMPMDLIVEVRSCAKTVTGQSFTPESRRCVPNLGPWIYSTWPDPPKLSAIFLCTSPLRQCGEPHAPLFLVSRIVL